MTAKTKGNLFSTANITRMAILGAVASVLYMLDFPIGMPFYKLDLSNIPVMVGGFAMGPVAGLIILAIKDLTGLLHSSSAGVGELADFIMSACMILPAAWIYARNKTRKTALISMLVGMVIMVFVSVFVNKWIMLPFYMGAFHMSMEQLVAAADWGGVDSEWKLLLMITAPFNLIKGLVISLLTAVLYKRISPLLHEKG